jgi:hypothetical protein
MPPSRRDTQKYAKARRRYRKAHERLARDRRQAQHAAKVLEQALEDLGLPRDLVGEIEGRLRSQNGKARRLACTGTGAQSRQSCSGKNDLCSGRARPQIDNTKI